MAVAFDGTRVANANADPEASGDWSSGSATLAVETEFWYQSTNSLSVTVKTSEIYVGFLATASANYTTTPKKIALLKQIVTSDKNLQTTQTAGMKSEIGS